MNKTPFRILRRTAFTLIELLVVIAIVAMLAGMASNGIMQAMQLAKITRATGDAKQIGLAMRAYASDHDGSMPSGPELNSSNDAFRELFPVYMQVEGNFAVSSSPVGKHADNKIEPSERALERGENHWAFVMGSTDTSLALWPLIVDHTDGSGHYTTDEKSPGGTWRGAKAVMIRVDGGAEAKSLKGTGKQRFLPRYDDDGKNALQVSEYMGEGARLLEPER